MNDDIHFAYNVLTKVLCDRPYVQHEFWGTRRGFKPDPILGSLEFIIDGGLSKFNQAEYKTHLPKNHLIRMCPQE